MSERSELSPTDVLANVRPAVPRSRRVIQVLLAIGVISGIAGAGWLWWSRRAASVGPEYETEPVSLGNLSETIIATGTLSPLDAVEIGAEVTGRVNEVNVQVNDRVKVGQVLAIIDPETLEAQVNERKARLTSARASYSSAKATVAEAKLVAKRTRELHKRKLASDQELQAAAASLLKAKAAVTAAGAEIRVAKAGLSSSNTALAKAEIRSPIDGMVLARSVEPGQTVTSGFQTPVLFTLARDLTRLELSVDVDEADVGDVREGQSAVFTVDAFPNKEFKSKVVRLHNLPKPETTVVTYSALLSVDNSERLLKPGMTATATITTSEHKNALLIPNAALRFDPKRLARKNNASRMSRRLLGGRRARGGRRTPKQQTPDVPAKRIDQVFVLRDGSPVRVVVRPIATDGKRSAVKSKKLADGDELVIDLAVEDEK